VPIKVDPFDRNHLDPSPLPQNAWVIEYEKIWLHLVVLFPLHMISVKKPLIILTCAESRPTTNHIPTSISCNFIVAFEKLLSNLCFRSIIIKISFPEIIAQLKSSMIYPNSLRILMYRIEKLLNLDIHCFAENFVLMLMLKIIPKCVSIGWNGRWPWPIYILCNLPLFVSYKVVVYRCYSINKPYV